VTNYTRTTYVDGTTPALSATNLNNNEAALDALYGAWTATSPAVSSTAGTITSASAVLRYVVQGRVCTFNVLITMTNNGTGSGTLTVALPVQAVTVTSFSGRNPTSGKMLQGAVSAGTSTLNIRNYDGTYPVATGETPFMSGSYEVA
jgi:hypothetical protein